MMWLRCRALRVLSQERVFLEMRELSGVGTSSFAVKGLEIYSAKDTGGCTKKPIEPGQGASM